jgi:signal transduction histidine kinase
MSKKENFHNRIDDLFAEDEHPQPEPVAGEQPIQVESTPEREPSPPLVEEVALTSKDLGVASPQRSGRVGWEDYLNAIDRTERLGFTFDQEAIENLLAQEPSSRDGEILEAPLQVGDAILGALQLEGEQWSDSEQQILSSIAQQVTQHIENLRLLEQAEQYREEAEQATRQLTHEGWEAYLETAAALSRGYTYDQNQVVAVEGDNPSEYTDFAGAITVQTKNLKVREEPIGQIAIADPQVDQETVANLLDTVSERLSTHIENLRLLDETERSRQQLDKRAAELETVAQVSTAAATILDPQALLQSVVDLTRYSFHLYHTSVYLLNETGDTLELTAASGKIGHAILEEGHQVRLYQDQSVIAKAARTRETIIVSDTRTDPEYLHHHLLPDAMSEMSVPLVVGEQLIGVFDVEAETTGRFTEEDVRTFNTLASQTAVALRNAQLYSEQMETVERLRELDHLKSSFLANMSHELRTPLNSILGFTQVILEGLDGPLTDDMTMDLELIEKNGQHLLSLINEVLDMAKIESGRVSLSLEPVNLPEMLNDVLRTTSSLAREGVAVENLHQLPQDMFIMADAVRLRQMLINMMGNAFKFTEKGSVNIQAEILDEKVQISIHDTGIGIPPDKLESIFEAFSQVDTSTTRKAGGTGLGLPISRRLAEMHGGWLWATSKGINGEGSVFYLELPIGNPESMTIH